MLPYGLCARDPRRRFHARLPLSTQLEINPLSIPKRLYAPFVVTRGVYDPARVAAKEGSL
jgi:hypothetical protein